MFLMSSIRLKAYLSIGFQHLLLILFSIIMAFPFVWMVISAIKTKEEIWNFPPTWWPENPQWNHFIEAWALAPFGQYLFNSVFTASGIVFLQLINSAFIAYAFTQFEFRGKHLLFSIILATYMLPAAATYVPSYVILAKFEMLDTYKGLILSNAVSVFGIFLFRQAFLQLPKEVVEAARVDGASHFQILWKICVPLTKPIIIAFSLLSFISNYNNYLWPSLIMKSTDKLLITAGLRQFFIQEGAYGIQWPLVMAASTFAVVPLLIMFVFGQKWFISGINDRGVKG
jgi:multiple sugar transport system permease protein